MARKHPTRSAAAANGERRRQRWGLDSGERAQNMFRFLPEGHWVRIAAGPLDAAPRRSRAKTFKAGKCFSGLSFATLVMSPPAGGRSADRRLSLRFRRWLRLTSGARRRPLLRSQAGNVLDALMT